MNRNRELEMKLVTQAGGRLALFSLRAVVRAAIDRGDSRAAVVSALRAEARRHGKRMDCRSTLFKQLLVDYDLSMMRKP